MWAFFLTILAGYLTVYSVPRVAKCKFFYTEQNLQTKFYPKKILTNIDNFIKLGFFTSKGQLETLILRVSDWLPDSREFVQRASSRSSTPVHTPKLYRPKTLDLIWPDVQKGPAAEGREDPCTHKSDISCANLPKNGLKVLVTSSYKFRGEGARDAVAFVIKIFTITSSSNFPF